MFYFTILKKYVNIFFYYQIIIAIVIDVLIFISLFKY